MAVTGLPSPLNDVSTVGFVVQNAIPSFEYFLAATVIPIESSVRVVDPRPIGVITRRIARCIRVGFGGGGGGGGGDGIGVNVIGGSDGFKSEELGMSWRRGNGSFSGKREKEKN